MAVLWKTLFPKSTVNPIEEGWLEGMSELHCHLLPEVDDGARNTDEPLSLITLMKKIGFKRIVFTPHLHNRYPDNNSIYLREEFDNFLANKLQETDLELYLGGEYMMDSFFPNHLNNPLLTLGKSNALLVEMSFAVRMLGYMDQIVLLQKKNVRPILAHPERYLYLSFDEYNTLKDCGCAFQLNLFSLCGAYGGEVQRRAEELLMGDYYDFVGTDTHRIQTLERMCREARMAKKYENPIRDLIENGNTLFR